MASEKWSNPTVCLVPMSWPTEYARHLDVRTRSIYPLPKMSPDRALVRHASPLVRPNPPVRLGDAKDGIWENAPVRLRCNEIEGAVGDERREQPSVSALHRHFELGR